VAGWVGKWVTGDYKQILYFVKLYLRKYSRSEVEILHVDRV